MKDKNGKPIEMGSEVLIRGKVVHLSDREDGLNATVEVIEDGPSGQKVQIPISTIQLEVTEPATAAATEEAPAAGKTSKAADHGKGHSAGR